MSNQQPVVKQADPLADKIAMLAHGAMTVRRAAKFSGISRTDLYSMMDSGLLPYIKPFKNRLIPRKALIQAMAAKDAEKR